MTPQESVNAFITYCMNNQGFKVTWIESGIAKYEILLTSTHTINRTSTLIPLIEEGRSVTVTKVNIEPTWEFYLEWLEI